MKDETVKDAFKRNIEINKKVTINDFLVTSGETALEKYQTVLNKIIETLEKNK